MWSFTSSGDKPWPKRNINLATALSVVLSNPLITPASNNLWPVSYRCISTLPALHWVTLTITIPRSTDLFEHGQKPVVTLLGHSRCRRFPSRPLSGREIVEDAFYHLRRDARKQLQDSDVPVQQIMRFQRLTPKPGDKFVPYRI